MYYNAGTIPANDVSVSKRQNGYKVATKMNIKCYAIRNGEFGK
jgi:hypothetical protein